MKESNLIKSLVLTIKDNEKRLVGIVYHDEERKMQIFYKTNVCTMEEIEELLKLISNVS